MRRPNLEFLREGQIFYSGAQSFKLLACMGVSKNVFRGAKYFREAKFEMDDKQWRAKGATAPGIQRLQGASNDPVFFLKTCR